MSGIIGALAAINQLLTIAEAAAPAVASIIGQARGINATIQAAQAAGRDLTDDELAVVDVNLKTALAAWDAAAPGS